MGQWHISRVFFALILVFGFMYAGYIFFVPFKSVYSGQGNRFESFSTRKEIINDEQNFEYRYTPLKDWKTCSYSPTSLISMRETKEFYKIGDNITVDISARDFNGNRREIGGDLIRIWIKDLHNGACAAGLVEDLHNGTYRGHLRLLWAGDITITARVIVPREAVALIHQRIESGLLIKKMVGTFKSGSVTEETDCTPRPEVAKRYRNVCNLTHQNSDLPWFCDRPKTVPCENWVANEFVELPVPNTPDEDQMLKIVNQEHNMHKTLHLKVKPENSEGTLHWHSNEVRKINLPCNKLPLKDTWRMETPVGYLHKGKWYSHQCRSTFDGTAAAFSTCLRGKIMWFMGDSTTRYMWQYVSTLLKLSIKSSQDHKDWSLPVNQTNDDGYVTVIQTRHGMPFYSFKSLTRGTHYFIDRIPANSTDIIVFHFFTHFLLYIPETIRSHLRQTVRSLKALKARAPEVKIVVKAPHTFHSPEDKGRARFYDIWARLFERIYREELASMEDEILFLDLWDITVAAESWDIHPNNTVLKPVIDHMMSFVCP